MSASILIFLGLMCLVAALFVTPARLLQDVAAPHWQPQAKAFWVQRRAAAGPALPLALFGIILVAMGGLLQGGPAWLSADGFLLALVFSQSLRFPQLKRHFYAWQVRHWPATAVPRRKHRLWVSQVIVDGAMGGVLALVAATFLLRHTPLQFRYLTATLIFSIGWVGATAPTLSQFVYTHKMRRKALQLSLSIGWSLIAVAVCLVA